jgi:hypothetical protein
LFTLGLFSVIDGMMDAPMHDVVASLPLAEDMREALVSRRGQMGQLLDCVTALETGEHGPASRFVVDAGDFYLEALMWANSAAESLFGDQSAGPARARSAPAAAAARRRPRHLAEPVASTPPPGSPAAAALADGARRDQPGFFRRVWARCLAVFGRRVGEARG